MTGEPRKPPLRLAARLRHVLGGRAGWRGVLVQILFVAVIIWVGYEVIANARANLQAQRIASGFGFLSNTAGFSISQTLIPYSESDTYSRVFLVGLLNTLLVSIIGIIAATIIGFLVALGRLSPNWLLSRISGGYIELIRNLPLLFQILFWYLAVLASLPSPRQSISLFGTVFLSVRGLIVPYPVPQQAFGVFVVAVAIGVLAALAMRFYARRRLFKIGQKLTIWPFVVLLVLGLPTLAVLLAGAPVKLDMPELRGFNFVGGMPIRPELAALAVALSTYTAAFIAEIVRAGIQSVPKGQMEAGASLGLSRGQTLRLVVIPQALRVILPPLTNQYLNLTKNSSLGVAIGYPDLFSVFAGTTLSQTGQAVEIIALTMGMYLLISLATSAIMALYGRHVNRSLAA